MSKAPSVPQPANPMQVAGAQTQSNIATALANARLGAINQVTPYGTVTYNFGTPTGAGAPGAGAAAAGAGGATAAVPPPGLAWENHVRSQLGMQPLQPGTPQYQQWLANQNQQQPFGGGADRAGVGRNTGMGPAGTARSAGTYGGGSLGGGPGAMGAGSNPGGPPGSW